MCGISTIIHKNNASIKEGVIDNFTNIIQHRGPDDEGYFFHKNTALGHRRLSIIDLSQAGHQPMQFEDLVISYNGEIYNYIELREELMELNYQFKSQTDTEVILAAYKAWGTDCFAKFNGMWAFIILNTTTDELIACRDYYGIKPIYLTSVGKYFAIASEIKQFTTLPDFKAKLNQNRAFDYLLNGLLNHTDDTLFEGVAELRGGNYLIYNIQTHSHTIQQWYFPERIKPLKNIHYVEAVNEVHRLLADSLKLRCRSDVNVGSCLSGGIDSSAMVLTLHGQKTKGFSLNTITSCYDNNKYDERQYSEQVNALTGFNSIKVFPNLSNLLDQNHLDQMIYHQDQPVLSASHYSEYNVFKTAREHNLIVMLDGQGSDEYFGGYGEFFTYRLFELFKSFRWSTLGKNIIEKGLHGRGAYTELRSFTRFLFEDKISRFFSGKQNQHSWLNKNLYSNWLGYRQLFPKQHRNIYDLSLDEMFYTSIPYQLHSEDRNSMLFSIESRLPYLDPRLVEFGLSLPSDFKIKGTVSKAVLRDAIPNLPDDIKNRHDKMGFVAPDDLWFIENANALRNEITNAITQYPMLFTKQLVEMYDGQVIGKKQYNPIFFRVLAFYRWMKIFNVEL